MHCTFYAHVHVLFGFLNVSLDLRCDVKSQFLRHGQRYHRRANYLSPPPVERHEPLSDLKFIY